MVLRKGIGNGGNEVTRRPILKKAEEEPSNRAPGEMGKKEPTAVETAGHGGGKGGATK